MAKDANEILIELKAENKLLRDKLDDSKKEITKLTGSVEKSSAKLGGFFKKIGALALTYISGRAVKAFVDLAGQLDSVGGSFENLAASAKGGSQGLLKAMQTASKGTVDNLSIMRSSNLAFQLMGEQVADQLPKMMEVATAAARAQGKKVSDMFNDIVVASGRRSIMILDNLGISSAVAAKYQDEFAVSLGKTRDQLNETEKSQAFFYAVMKAGGETIKAVGNEGLTFGEKMQIIEARTKNAAQNMTQALIPELEKLADAFLVASEDGGAFQIVMEGIGKAATVVIRSLATVIELLNKATSAGRYDAALEHQEKAKQALKEMEAEYQKRYGVMWEAVLKGGKAHKAEYDALMQNRKVVKEMVGEVKKYGKESEDVDKRIAKIWEDTQNRKADKARRTQQQITQSTADGITQRQLLENQAKVAEYTGEFEESELIKKQLEYEALLELKTAYENDAKAIEDAYAKKRLLAENEARKKKLEAETTYYKAKLGMMSVEWDTLKEITSKSSTLMSSNNKKLFKLGKALAYVQAVMNAAEAITKAWAQGGIYGAALAAITAAATAVQIGKIKATKMPSYEKGFVPVLAQGTVPQDHYPAFIGTNEAVMNRRATSANADLLREMNATGQRVDTGKTVNVSQTVSFSGNVMSKDYINNHVILELKTQARYMGKELFAEKR